MNLYRAYKNTEMKKKQEQQDREAVGAKDEIIIIYEKSIFKERLKSVITFLILLVLVGIAVIIFINAR